MDSDNNKIMYIIAYLIPILTGIIVYVLYADKDKNLKFQSVQAIILGIGLLILGIIFDAIGIFALSPVSFAAYRFISYIFDIIVFLIWLYGLYTGYKASKGGEANIPFIADYAKDYSK